MKPNRDACVRKPYSYANAEKEVEKLRESDPQYNWTVVYCDECKYAHVHREKPCSTK